MVVSKWPIPEAHNYLGDKNNLNFHMNKSLSLGANLFISKVALGTFLYSGGHLSEAWVESIVNVFSQPQTQMAYRVFLCAEAKACFSRNKDACAPELRSLRGADGSFEASHKFLVDLTYSPLTYQRNA